MLLSQTSYRLNETADSCTQPRALRVLLFWLVHQCHTSSVYVGKYLPVGRQQQILWMSYDYLHEAKRQKTYCCVFSLTSCLLFLFQVSAFLLEFMFWKAVKRTHSSSGLRATEASNTGLLLLDNRTFKRESEWTHHTHPFSVFWDCDFIQMSSTTPNDSRIWKNIEIKNGLPDFAYWGHWEGCDSGSCRTRCDEPVSVLCRARSQITSRGPRSKDIIPASISKQAHVTSWPLRFYSASQVVWWRI